VFENIIEQGAVSQLRDDIFCGKNAPSMLFFGPFASGKGSAALELARVLSCVEDASWKCSCPFCERHRYLQHDDLLMLGKRSFMSEISACCSVFLRNKNAAGAKLLFFRSLRKLQIRFSPVIMEDDPKFGKVFSVLQSLDEGLNELLLTDTQTADGAVLEKLCRALVKDALTLESDGMGVVIPINHIRRASYWCRLAPNGKRKTLIIENAENMRDEARNSLLKLLEEPPSSVSIVLTAIRREAIMPTILSRLRPYRFLKRSAEGEKEVLNRVFKTQTDLESASLRPADGKIPETGYSLIGAYLDSFLPQNTEKLYPLAAWFVVSLARIAALSFRKSVAADIPRFMTALGERYAPIAETFGLERSVKSADIVKTLLSQSGNFEDDSFSRFLKLCLNLAGSVAREAEEPQYVSYNDIFRKYINETVTAVDVLNQSTTLALEALLHNMKTAVVRGRYG
jgi:DNA polymerase-3 subunit gamma/tau